MNDTISSFLRAIHIDIYIYITETICSQKYGSDWGFEIEQEISFRSANDYITAYGLDDGLIKFKKLLSTHAKVELSSLTGK